MSPLVITILGIIALFLLMAMGMPIAFCFALIGTIGVIAIRGFDSGLYILGSAPYQWASMSALICLPLFILMGNFAFHSEISKDLYMAARKWVGKFPGGLAHATTIACTLFAACTGSSLAGAATMGAIAFPEMERFKYDRRLSTGCISAGGTLGILIPPSSVFIMYGFITGTPIGQLFIAGIFPGLLLSLLFLVVIFVMCKVNPKLGPSGPSFSWRERLVSVKGIWGMLALFVLVIGGLYVGIFTPSEAGAVGALGAFIIGLTRRSLKFSRIVAALRDTLRISCFILTITIGAMIFNTFLATSGFTGMFGDWIASLPVSPYVILVSIIIMYIPLGMVMDALSMMLLTMPVVFPIIENSGFDLIWFGVLIVITQEMALITPPVGMAAYVVQGVTKVPLGDVFRGITPFFIMMLVCLAILLAFPQISLFLPALMK